MEYNAFQRQFAHEKSSKVMIFKYTAYPPAEKQADIQTNLYQKIIIGWLKNLFILSRNCMIISSY